MNTKKADFDVDAYVKEVLVKSSRNAAEGSIDGELTKKETVVQKFSFKANSWVEHGNSRLLLTFGDIPNYLNLEVKSSGLGSTDYKFSIPPDFVFVDIGNGERWHADTAHFSDLSFDQVAKKISGKLEATILYNVGGDVETGKLKAEFEVSVV